MLAAERLSVIMQRARREGAVRVVDLVSQLGVSDVTVRRDLDMLVQQGRLTKVHGGAVLTEQHLDDASEVAAANGMAASGYAVGMLVPKSSYYFTRMVEGARAVLSGHGARLVLAVSEYQSGREQELCDGLLRAGAAGLLLVPGTNEVGGSESSWLTELPVPVVLLERRLPEPHTAGICWVRTAHEAGTALAVWHLKDLGHERIALFTRGDTPSARRVGDGWLRALNDAGLPTDTPIVQGSEIPGWPLWSPEQVAKFITKIRKAGATALLCHNDEDALAIVQYASSAGFAVPDDLSIVAYDDEIAELASPALTAVSPPKTHIGDLAARTLIDLLADPGMPARHIEVEPRLVVRESTAPPHRTE